jgi:hypothetical protein
MVKIGLWLGAPTLVTFLVSSSPVRMEYTLVIFALALIALFMGIGPQSSDKGGR